MILWTSGKERWWAKATSGCVKVSSLRKEARVPGAGREATDTILTHTGSTDSGRAQSQVCRERG